MPQSPQLKQGEIIKGTYRVLAKLGEGGMGAVYKVEQLVIGRLCALKTINLPSDPQAQQNARQRFQHEARTISKLCHHSIVQVYDFGLTDSGTPYYTMDLIEGKTLLERIKEHGQLEMREALAIFIEVAEGLAYAHSQSVVHRDIKPSNIMIVDHGGQKTGGRVKIVDFGLAKKSEMRPAAGALITAQQTEPELLGSPPYMSPEQCQNGEVDHRSDIYSFGCTLFEALTGVPPFIGESALVISMKHATEEPPSLKQASLGKDFPTDLELIEKRLLAKDPHQRYQDMNVVREDLMAVLQNLEKLPNSTGGGANSNRRGQSAGSDKSQSEGAFERQDNADNGASSPAALRILIFLLPIILGGAALAAVLTIGRHAPGRSASHHDAKQPLVTTEPVKTAKDSGSLTLSNAAFGGPTMSNAASRGFISDDSNLVGQESKIPFLTKAVGPTGEKLKVFQFPTDHSMGLLIDQGKVRDTGLQARGQVIIPANKRLRLQVSPFLTIHPSYFRRFGPDDVAEIAMINNEGVTNETLNYMDHLAGLIDLTVFETNVNDDCIPTLDALTGLDTLNVSNTNITGTKLAKLKTLSQLKHLEINRLAEVGPAIKALASSTKMENLHADSVELTRDDLINISKIRQLKGLSITGTKIGLPGLEILSHCPALHGLEISRNDFDLTVIPYLKKFPHLIWVRINCDNWTKEQVTQLKTALPQIEFVIEEPI